MIRPLLLILTTACIAAAACSGGGKAPTPRRHAYPRIAACDSSYIRVASAPLHFEANTATEAHTDSGGRWLTLRYPAYNADAYITFTNAADTDALRSTIANRRERISLNLAGAQAETTHILSTDSTFDAAVVEAPGTSMPLQFIATDGREWVVSGAVQLDIPSGAPYDSIRPVVAVLRRDILHALSRLSIND